MLITVSESPLPVMAQLLPVFGILANDLNKDGRQDLFLAGNFFGLKPQTGRFDASYGSTFLGAGGNTFNYVHPAISGLLVKGEARDIATIRGANGAEYIAVAINNDKLCLFKRKSNR
ncbi:hypothetical protein [Segetibacter aerophilus]|uniref:VCBS repeat-containing protein n=1 Tax=Segetibacter aerophilus TaxID=670293 RepID=A0A512B8Z8_9BACT|nr:hypothetical protein [Segetibacter aerophilus]GEO08413.1 hypothetical protein SAE01_09090 [Segetibacter aerophilus]